MEMRNAEMWIDNYVIDITGKKVDIQIDIYKFRMFIILQGFAILLLFVSLKQYVNNRIVYENNVEYQPVTVTYTSSDLESYTILDGQSHRSYSNQFQYEVNGIVYSYTAHNQSTKVYRGAKDIWYYNPNNPEQIVPYASIETVKSGRNTMIYFYVILQVIAIFLLKWSIGVWKKVQGLSWNSGAVLDWKPEGAAWNESAEWKPEGTAWSESAEWESGKQDFEAWAPEQEQEEQ